MQIGRKRAFQEGPASAGVLTQEHSRLRSEKSREARMATPEQQGRQSLQEEVKEVEGLTVYGSGFILGKTGANEEF